MRQTPLIVRIFLLLFASCAFAGDAPSTLSVEEKLQLRDLEIAVLQAQLRGKDFETQAQAAYAQARENLASLNTEIKQLKDKYKLADEYQLDSTFSRWVLSKPAK